MLEKQWNMEKSRKNQISALAHDIKTPLTIIKGNAELVKEVSQNDEQVKYNDYIIKATNEIEHYLKVLVDMTKSEEPLVLKLKKIETKGLLKKIIDQTQALISEKNIRLINRQEVLPEFIDADEELLYRAIMNVISNAVEYSEKDGRLLFHTRAIDCKLQFIISDSGKGFSIEDLKCATDQFYRGDKSRKSKNHYGIGLSIAKTFIELHHGNIKLSNSQEFGGTQVTLEIPI